jgi:hypothetical protein
MKWPQPKEQIFVKKRSQWFFAQADTPSHRLTQTGEEAGRKIRLKNGELGI